MGYSLPARGYGEGPLTGTQWKGEMLDYSGVTPEQLIKGNLSGTPMVDVIITFNSEGRVDISGMKPPSGVSVREIYYNGESIVMDIKYNSELENYSITVGGQTIRPFESGEMSSPMDVTAYNTLKIESIFLRGTFTLQNITSNTSLEGRTLYDELGHKVGKIEKSLIYSYRNGARDAENWKANTGDNEFGPKEAILTWPLDYTYEEAVASSRITAYVAYPKCVFEISSTPVYKTDSHGNQVVDYYTYTTVGIPEAWF